MQVRERERERDTIVGITYLTYKSLMCACSCLVFTHVSISQLSIGQLCVHFSIATH